MPRLAFFIRKILYVPWYYFLELILKHCLHAQRLLDVALYHMRTQVTRKQCCVACEKEDNEELLMLCDGCDTGCAGRIHLPPLVPPADDSSPLRRYHTYCLKPPLKEVPKCDWFCPQCAELEKEADAGGFNGGDMYTLAAFKDLADSFKSKWFETGAATPGQAREPINMSPLKASSCAAKYALIFLAMPSYLWALRNVRRRHRRRWKPSFGAW